MDCEPGEINNRIPGCRAVHADLGTFFREALAYFESQPVMERPAWHEQIRRQREAWPDIRERGDIPGIDPNAFMHQLAGRFPEVAAFVVDVGQHQMWAAQSLEIGPAHRFLTCGGMGAMGYALPAAIGASVGMGGAPVLMIAGDGGFQCNIQELQTMVRNSLPVKMVIVNNRCLGMVRQFQESYFEGRYQSTLWGYSAPDFAQVARAFGIPARTLADPEDTAEALDWLAAGGAALLQVMVDPGENVHPKLAFGSPIGEMEPFARP